MTGRTGVVIGLALLAPRAQANSGYLELQLRSEVLLDVVREHLVPIEAGCPHPFDHEGESTIIDHLEWQTPSIALEPWSVQMPGGGVLVPHPVVEFPVDVHLKSVACVTDPSCAVDDTEVITASLEFSIFANKLGQLTFDAEEWPLGFEICAEYAGTDTPLPAGAADQIEALIDEATGAYPDTFLCSELPLGDLTGILAGRVDGDRLSFDTPVWTSASPSLDRIAFRVSLDTYPWGHEDLPGWQEYFDGEIAPNDGGDFSLFLEQEVLAAAFADPFWIDMLCPDDDADPSANGCLDDIEPVARSYSWPPDMPEMLGTTWSESLPGLIVAIEADAPFCGFDEVTLTLPFALSGDTLEVAATWGIPEVGLASCVGDDPIPAEVWDLLDGIADEAVQMGNGASCAVGAPGHVDCGFSLFGPSIDGPGGDAVFAVTEVNGWPNGLSIEGTVTLPPAIPPAPLTLEATDFEIGVVGDCYDLHIANAGYLTVGGGPAAYCDDPLTGAPSPYLRDDPLGIYDLAEVDGGPADEIEVQFPKADPAPFWLDDYPAEVTVWSTVGSGTIEVGTPSSGTADWTVLGDLVSAYVDCMRLETGLFGIPGKFDYHWLVDPPPYEMVAVGGNGGAATARQITVTQTAAGSTDPRTGLYTIPASAATMSVTWSVATGGTAIDFTSTVPLTVDLIGKPLQHGYAVSLAAPMTGRFVVPRASLPRGVTSAAVEATFDAGAGLLTGIVVR